MRANKTLIITPLLTPLVPGEGVLSIVLTGSRCRLDKDAGTEKAYRKNNRLLRRRPVSGRSCAVGD